MKKQINFGLFLAFLFIVWLFVNTWIRFNQTKESKQRYAMFKNDRYTIIYDRETGEAWRYFATYKEGELFDEGWVRLVYKDILDRGITPMIMRQHYERREKNLSDAYGKIIEGAKEIKRRTTFVPDKETSE